MGSTGKETELQRSEVSRVAQTVNREASPSLSSLGAAPTVPMGTTDPSLGDILGSRWLSNHCAVYPTLIQNNSECKLQYETF